jgi:hypothetical protein
MISGQCDLITSPTDANKSRPDLDLAFLANRLFDLLNSNVFDPVVSSGSHFDSLSTSKSSAELLVRAMALIDNI